MAGEKGSIGKLQGLGLGITGIVVSSLLIPDYAKADWAKIDYTDEAGHGNWTDYNWDDDESHIISDKEEDGNYNDIRTYNDEPDPDYSDHDDDHSDHTDWDNVPPQVRIEVE